MSAELDAGFYSEILPNTPAYNSTDTVPCNNIFDSLKTFLNYWLSGRSFENFKNPHVILEIIFENSFSSYIKSLENLKFAVKTNYLSTKPIFRDFYSIVWALLSKWVSLEKNSGCMYSVETFL